MARHCTLNAIHCTLKIYEIYKRIIHKQYFLQEKWVHYLEEPFGENLLVAHEDGIGVWKRLGKF